MATSVNVGFPIWCDGQTFNGLIGRTWDVAAMAYTSGSSTVTAVRGGVLPAGGTSALQVSIVFGTMTFTVNPGYCVVANSTSAVFGAYRFGMLTQATLTCAASDPTNPRIDLVVAQVVDNGDPTSFAQIAVITGTPAGIPSVPALPANSIPLAQISVPAGVTSLSNIADKRVWTVPPGGILPVATASVAPAGQQGSYIHDLSAGRLAHNASGAVRQAALFPWVTQVATRVSDVTSTAAEVTVLTASITVDGLTDIEVFYSWYNVNDPGTGTGNPFIYMSLYIDAARVQRIVTPTTTTANFGGGTNYYRTTGGLGTTPSAGTHTIAWKFQPSGGNGTDVFHLVAAAGQPAQLVVKPVCL